MLHQWGRPFLGSFGSCCQKIAGLRYQLFGGLPQLPYYQYCRPIGWCRYFGLACKQNRLTGLVCIQILKQFSKSQLQALNKNLVTCIRLSQHQDENSFTALEWMSKPHQGVQPCFLLQDQALSASCVSLLTVCKKVR